MGIKDIRREHLAALIGRPDVKTQAAFAERVGLPPSYVSQLQLGRREIGHSVARKIEAAFRLSEGAMDLPLQGVALTSVPLGRVPLALWDLRGRSKAAQSKGSDMEKMVFTTRSVGPRAFALKVRGDAMAPRYPDGCTIIVDPDQPVKNGSRVVAQHPKEDEATFRVYVEDGGKKYLRALNPAYGPQIPMDGYVLHGVVVQSITDEE